MRLPCDQTDSFNSSNKKNRNSVTPFLDRTDEKNGIVKMNSKFNVNYTKTSATSIKRDNRLLASVRPPLQDRKNTPVGKRAQYQNATPLEACRSNRQEVAFQSFLRVRPLNSLESQDDSETVQLEICDGLENTVCLYDQVPNNKKRGVKTLLSEPRKSRTKKENKCKLNSKEESDHNSSTLFQFDSVFDPTMSQKNVYDSVGINIALDAMQPILSNIQVFDRNQNEPDDSSHLRDENFSHVIMSLGTSNSGKTHTLFGPMTENTNKSNQSNKRKAGPRMKTVEDQRGLVPRLLEDLFMQGTILDMKEISPRKTGTKRVKNHFFLKLTMIHLYKDHLYDMLSTIETNERENDCSAKNTRQKSNNIESTYVQRVATSFEKHSKTQHPKNMKELRIGQNPRTLDFQTRPTVIECHNKEEAQSILLSGLENNTIARTATNESSSRGHTIITIKPIYLSSIDDYRHQGGKIEDLQTIEKEGGTITIIDMAGIERTKLSSVSGRAMKESVSINSSIFATLQCLRSIKQKSLSGEYNIPNTKSRNLFSTEDESTGQNHEQENIFPDLKSQSPKEVARNNEVNDIRNKLIPYRQNKLTMLLQPLFSGSFQNNTVSQIDKDRFQKDAHHKTTVTLFVSAYPGGNDYSEKKSLLAEIDKLRGMKMTDLCETPSKIKSTDDYIYEGKRNKINECNEINLNTSNENYSNQQRVSFNTDIHKKAQQINQHSYSTEKEKRKRKSESQQSPLKCISNALSLKVTRKKLNLDCEDKSVKIKLLDQINDLKKKLAQVEDENNILDSKCKMLEQENKSLKQKCKTFEDEKNDRTVLNQRKKTQNKENFSLKDRKNDNNCLLPNLLIQHMKNVEKSHFLFEPTLHSGTSRNHGFPLNIPDSSIRFSPGDNVSPLELLEKLERHVD